MAENREKQNQSPTKPPEYGLQVDDAGYLPEGIYVLMNKATRTVLDLAGGNSANGTVCQGWGVVHDGAFAGSRWVLRRDGARESYTLRNMFGGTFLDLDGGNPENGRRTIGCARNPPESQEHRGNQEWHIKATDDDFFSVQNVRASTFLELKDSSAQNGTPAVCSAFVEGKDAQLWDFEKVSKSGSEIISILGDWKEDLLSRVCLPYGPDAQYFVIPESLRRQLWDQTGLRLQPLRKHIFDHDDFIIKSKEAVTSWALDKIKVDGYSALFGLIYGQGKKGPNAYNWCLSPDMHSLVFFDAQTGKEYTSAAMDARGFRPSFSVL